LVGEGLCHEILDQGRFVFASFVLLNYLYYSHNPKIKPMKHMKLKDYLFFTFLVVMAAIATSCEPEAVEVWPGVSSGVIIAPEDSLESAPPCDSLLSERLDLYYQINQQSNNENNSDFIPCNGVCGLQEGGR
jgi:hypothetical protein